jgi:hypothetical protein
MEWRKFLPPLQGLEFFFDDQPRATLADSLCPGLLSFGLAALELPGRPKLDLLSSAKKKSAR